MASITFRQSTKYGTEPYAVLTVTQQSQNTTAKTSTIAYTLTLYRPSNVSSSTNKSYSIVINGSTVKSGKYSIKGSGTKTIASGTTTVAHNSDGTKTLSFSGSVQFGITWSGTSIGTITNSGSMVLTKITTAAVMPSVLNISGHAEVGGSIHISLTTYSQWSRHVITVSSGSNSYTYPESVFSGGIFEFPASRYNSWFASGVDEIPLTFTVVTYDYDQVNVGTTTDTVTLYKPVSATENTSSIYIYDGSIWEPCVGHIYVQEE